MTRKIEIEKTSQNKYRYLAFSVLLDLMGMASYLIPFLAELGDVVFAPIYGLAIFAMYRKRKLPAAFAGVIGVIEELLPGTDFIPTASLMWIYYFLIKK